MKIAYFKLLLGAAFLASAVLFADVRPQTETGALPSAETDRSIQIEPNARKYPFRGMVHSVDAAQNRILLKGRKENRVLRLTADTVLERGGKVVNLDEIQEGDQAKGTLVKDVRGEEILVKGTFEGQ